MSESVYIRDKKMHEVDDDLFFSIEAQRGMPKHKLVMKIFGYHRKLGRNVLSPEKLLTHLSSLI